MQRALAGVAQLAGASSGTPKGFRFNSQSGHTPSMQVRSRSVRAHKRGNQLMFLSHDSVSLSLSLPLPLFLKAMKKRPQVRIKKNRKENAEKLEQPKRSKRTKQTHNT